MRKILDSITPFNEIFYKTCFYNPFLSGVYYLGGEIRPFLCNDFFVYQFNDSNGFNLNINFVESKPTNDILKGMNIGMDSDFIKLNIINEIKIAIDNNHPVIVPIDRFYWNSSLNKTMYQIKHFAHFFLITGYDNLSKLFTTIDVSEASAFVSNITYENLLECSEGYLRWKNGKPTMKISKLHNIQKEPNLENHLKPNDYIDIFKYNLNNNLELLINGNEALLTAAENFESPEFIQALNDQPSIDIAIALSTIPRVKKCELYRVYKLLNKDRDLFAIAEQINRAWEIVRSVLLKAVITKNLDKSSGISIGKRMEELYFLENKYLRMLGNFIH